MEDVMLIKKVTKAAKWSTITELVAKSIAPITTMILARLFTPEVFGIVAVINMIIVFADIFTDSGFQKFLVQSEFKDEKEKSKYATVAFWTNLGLSFLIWLFIAVFAKKIAIMMGNAGLGYAITIACMSLPLTAFSSIEMALFRRDFDFKSLFVVRIIGTCTPFIVTIPLAIIYHSYWALIIGTICGNLSNAIVLTLYSKWRPNLFYDFLILKKMFSFSIWSLVEAISIWLTMNIDVLILVNALNNYYLGVYKTAILTVSQLTGIIPTATTQLLFSTLSRLKNNEKKYKLVLFKFQRLVGMLVFPMSVGIYVYRELITNIVLGSNWNDAIEFIGLWGLLSGISIVICSYSSEVYRSKGKPKLSFVAQLLYTLALIPVLLIGSFYSFQVLYRLRTFACIIFIIIHLIIISRIIKISIKEMIYNIFPPLLCSIIMGCFAFALQKIARGVIWDLISIMLCMVFYFSILMLFSKIRKELIGLVKPKIDNVILKISKFKERG